MLYKRIVSTNIARKHLAALRSLHSQSGSQASTNKLPHRPDYPAEVKLVEVSARDGLQNEKKLISAKAKIAFIDLLSQAGLPAIEVTSFVSPKWIPQMADHKKVFAGIQKLPKVAYPVLALNQKGLEDALAAGADEIAIFLAASELFTRKNVNCSMEDNIRRAEQMASDAQKAGARVRGYISTVISCPYEGKTRPGQVSSLCERLLQMGCYEISLGDTIGVGTPHTMRLLLEELCKHVPASKLAVHCHDTYGQALANILTALEFGICTVDSSAAGLGGCPFAKGATGNVATEDVLYMLNDMGIRTGVDMERLLMASDFICKELQRPTASRAGRAIRNKQQQSS